MSVRKTVPLTDVFAALNDAKKLNGAVEKGLDEFLETLENPNPGLVALARSLANKIDILPAAPDYKVLLDIYKELGGTAVPVKKSLHEEAMGKLMELKIV